MARPAYGGRTTCESCKSIDVRRWHREGWLSPGRRFSCSWTSRGEPSGNIGVRTESDAAVLVYRSRSYGDAEWRPIEQRVPIVWTACPFGGRRPWFLCSVSANGRYCGRRVALLYAAGELFACRCCYDLAYASQHEALHHRGWVRRKRSECAWAVVPICLSRSRTSRKACTGALMSVSAARMTLPKSARTSASCNFCSVGSGKNGRFGVLC